jgi:Ni,Fe-hydrogenase I cytochrome b subunit
MPADAVNNAVSLFFITCECHGAATCKHKHTDTHRHTQIIFQPISSALGKAVGVKYWMPFLMVSWGLFTLAHAYVKSEGELIAFRLMVGV